MNTDLTTAIQALSACCGLQFRVQDGRLFTFHLGLWVDPVTPAELRERAARYRARGMLGLARPLLAVADAMEGATHDS